VGAVWALLVVNTLGSQGPDTLVTIPRPVIQMFTMGAMLAAFGLALVLNPRLRIRPNVYLFLLSLLVVVSVAGSAQLEAGYGALFRCARLAVFVATLWLLSPWFADSLRFVRYHIRALSAVLAMVAVGLIVAPDIALSEFYGGRLAGAFWPLSSPQIGFYAAMVIGLTILMRLGGRTDRWSVVLVAGPATILLLLTHTRTATISLLVGLTVAIGSLALTSARARRALAWVVVAAGLVGVLLWPAVVAWFKRGEKVENLASLNGRRTVWDALLYAPRTTSEQLIGTGLSDKSFGGNSIDNSWLAVYHEQGLIGLVIVTLFLACLLIAAALRPPSPERACAIFLIVYCLVASYTEAGLGDASPYLLNLALATALLTPGWSRTAAAVSATRTKVT
jgi:O-antigen ligase